MTPQAAVGLLAAPNPLFVGGDSPPVVFGAFCANPQEGDTIVYKFKFPKGYHYVIMLLC